jgi:hypothetical protein
VTRTWATTSRPTAGAFITGSRSWQNNRRAPWRGAHRRRALHPLRANSGLERNRPQPAPETPSKPGLHQRARTYLTLPGTGVPLPGRSCDIRAERFRCCPIRRESGGGYEIPTPREAFRGLGKLSVGLGSFAAAWEDFPRVREALPRPGKTSRGSGKRCRGLGRLSAALRRLAEVWERFPRCRETPPTQDLVRDIGGRPLTRRGLHKFWGEGSQERFPPPKRGATSPRLDRAPGQPRLLLPATSKARPGPGRPPWRGQGGFDHHHRIELFRIAKKGGL